MIETNKIYQGDALEVLKTFPDESINCVMTSPPYWALRDYGNDKQLGLEKTFDGYINKLCNIFDEVKRVLRDDGTCWVNIGDTYSNNNPDKGGQHQPAQGVNRKGSAMRGYVKGMQSKCLIGIPFRFAIEMINRGWILRNTIIWHKNCCMPSSVKDRFTIDFEYIFFFVKNKKYFFETQREPHKSESLKDMERKNRRVDINLKNNQRDYEGRTRDEFYHPDGRNKRAVWTINPKPFKESHFAVFPEELCETPLKAGCPEFICNKCGKPREKIIETKSEPTRPAKDVKANEYDPEAKWIGNGLRNRTMITEANFKGLTDCGCNAGFSGGIALDPFFGSGTLGVVALKQNKRFIGIELNPEYIKIAERRLKPYLEQQKL